MEYVISAADKATVANKRAQIGVAGAASYRARLDGGDMDRLLRSEELASAFRELTGRALWKSVDLLHLKMQSRAALGESLPKELRAAWRDLHLSALPRIGLGTFAMYTCVPKRRSYMYMCTPNENEAVAAQAYEHGCRLFDFFDPTRSGLLHKENDVRRLGDELRGKDMRDVVLISKADFLSLDCLRTQFDVCVKALGAQRKPDDQPLIDVYMLHYPVGLTETPKGLVPTEGFDLRATWQQMEQLVEDRLVRSLGVSNFSLEQLTFLLEKVCVIKPCVHQFEHHPFCAWKDMVALCHENGIACVASSPLAGGAVLTSKAMRSAAERIATKNRGLEVTPTQAALLWNLNQHVTVIPGIADPAHISENFSTPSMLRQQFPDADVPKIRVSKMAATFPQLKGYMDRHGTFVEDGDCVRCVPTQVSVAAAEVELPRDAIETIAQTQAIVSTFERNELVYKRRNRIAKMCSGPSQLAPMVVVSLADFERHGSVPRRETTGTRFGLRNVEDLSRDSKVIFISQRWLTAGSPDDPSKAKFHGVVAASRKWAELNQCPEHNLFLWMDWPCIVQDAFEDAVDLARFANDEGRRGVNSLGLYVASCDGFVAVILPQHRSTLFGNEYWQRGWCRVELMFGEAAQTKMFTFEHEKQTLEPIHLEELGALPPEKGKLAHPDDGRTIAKLVQVAELMQGRLAYGDFCGVV